MFVTQRIPPQVPEDSNFTDRLVLLKFDFNAIMRSSHPEIVLGTQLFYNFFLLPGQFGFLSLFFCLFGLSSFDFVMTVFHNVKILLLYADVNPCKRNNGGCAHYCTRLNREYNCSCSSGFKLNADRHTCTGKNDLEIHIIKTG